MNAFEIFNSIGITAILGAFIYIGRKLQMLDTLNDTVNKIKINLKVVTDYLTSVNADFDHTELQAYSPLQLTPKGSKLIKSIGFDTVFRNHQDDFCNFIDEEKPKLKYDVERSAIRSISALYDRDYMDFLKVYFYNNPGRSLKNIAPTLGVYIRDMYLKKHPEITE